MYVCPRFTSTESLSRHKSTKKSLHTLRADADSLADQETFFRQLVAKPKSLFTGAGLGLRNDDVPKFNPQGSAKSFIRKVMEEGDF